MALHNREIGIVCSTVPCPCELVPVGSELWSFMSRSGGRK